MEGSERRRDQRVRFQVMATVEADDRRIQSKETEDLSVRGLYVKCSEPLDPGVGCRVLVQLSGTKSRLELEMEGKVIRSSAGEGFAIEFTSVDLDCYTYLKNIVEYNRTDLSQKGPVDFESDD